MIYGYGRVSTDGQSVAAQVKQLRDAGAEEIFRETASGAKTDRRELARAIDALAEGDIDGAFVGAPPHSLRSEFCAFVWRREPLVLVLPATHPLSAAPSLRLAQLRAEGWIMVSREAAPAFRRQFDALCEREKFEPKVVQESERVAAVLTMVAASQGVSLLPTAVQKILSQGVIFRPISGRRQPTLDHTFVYTGKNPALLDFVALLRKFRRAQN